MTIEKVDGAYSVPLSGGPIGPSGSVFLPFELMFANGLLDVTSKLISQGLNSNTYFNSLALNATAMDAVKAFDNERKEIEDTITGSDGGAGARGLTIINTATGDDLLTGSNAANLLRGLAGNDTIRGLHGDDWLEGGLGGDTLDGGSGSDTATYKNASTAIGIRLSDTSYQAGEAVGDILISIENVEGSAFNDLISGNEADNRLWGGNGADTIGAGDGNDEVFGGAGDDFIDVRYYGVSYATQGHNLIDGGDGNDTILAFGGMDTLQGGDGDDSFQLAGNVVSFFPTTYNLGDDVVDGGAGVDTLSFGFRQNGAVIDMIAGRAFVASTGNLVLFTGIENVTGTSFQETIYGNAGDNVIRGGGGGDTIYGGGGNDTLWGSNGSKVYGGTGTDIAVIQANVTDVTFSFIEGGIRGVLSTGDVLTIYKDIETIQFNDTTRTYAQIAGPLQSAFDVISDNPRFAEGVTGQIALLANDINFNSQPI